MEQTIEKTQTLIADLYGIFGLDPAWELLGNTLLQYTVSILVFVLAYVLFKIVQKIVIVRLAHIAERTPTNLDNTFVKMVRSFRPPFYAFLAFWLAFQFLNVHGLMEQVLTAVVIVWIIYQAVIAAGILIDDVLLERVAKDKDPTTRSALTVLTRLAKGAIWGLGLILLLSNLGVDVTGLLAGVGIGGIAIAFALQGILSDLFSSFSIYFDKPFEVGDFIIVGDKLGTVENIGIKSTRLRALSGEELVLSNHFLTGAQIQNFKKMEERRVVFQLGVTYDTSVEKVLQAVEIVKQAIIDEELARLDRVHFFAFGDFALKIEAVYLEKTPDYNVYMDTQQAINVAIKRRFAEEGIQMAFPTQTIHMAKE
jgi:small-conductance mechanosensitive channel